MINEFRQLVMKYVPNELRQLALWSSLLLLQSQTWRDVRLSWTLICEIFLNWGTNLVSLKSYEDLCDRVSKMENDPELSHLLDLIYIGNSSTVDDNAAETLNEDDPIDGETIDLTDFQNDHLYTKNVRSICSIDHRVFFLNFCRSSTTKVNCMFRLTKRNFVEFSMRKINRKVH